MSKLEYSSTRLGKDHPDFQIQWVKDLLAGPGVRQIRLADKEDPDLFNGRPFSTMFLVTLWHESGIRAHMDFTRPSNEPDAVLKSEVFSLMSLGTGLDGLPGRLHGGLTSLLCDHITGIAVANGVGRGKDEASPATATMTVDYKAPVDTPGVIVVRAWITEISGRKVWTKGVIEDGKGTVCGIGKALFIRPRPKALL